MFRSIALKTFVQRIPTFASQQHVVRCFASAPTDLPKKTPVPTPAPKAEEHQDHSVEGRYATALFHVATKKNNLEEIWSDLEGLRTCLLDSRDFKLFLETPGISVAQKVAVIKGMSSKFTLTEPTTNFLELLLENHRLTLLRKIIDSFENFYRVARGELKCIVTSAEPLSEERQLKVKEALEKRHMKNKLMISFNTSPTILGGLVVRLGDQTLDYSIASRIERLQSQLLAPLNASSN